MPPSLVFYTGARIEKLETPDDVASHLAQHPRARVVIDSRQEQLVAAIMPVGCGVLARVPTLSGRDFLLLGPLPVPVVPLAINAPQPVQNWAAIHPTAAANSP